MGSRDKPGNDPIRGAVGFRTIDVFYRGTPDGRLNPSGARA